MDPSKVFITGLSAGGAMANVMLASYPELFAGGAIIGGLAYGMASGVGQAFERMQGRNPPSARQLRSALTAGSPSGGSWPRISVWHGTHDQTVKPINAEQIAGQWGGAHETAEMPNKVETINGHIRKVWLDKSGKEAIEVHMVKGMMHGVPLSSQAKAPLGNTGPFMLEAGISSTARIARTWGLADDGDVAAAEEMIKTAAREPNSEGIEAAVDKAMGYAKSRFPAKSTEGKGDASQGIGKVINDALRAAGLMR
jgi:poly(3-hydroxybutyrate) depolymerase